MIFTIQAMKTNFFDRKTVVDKVAKAKLRVLNQTGAYLKKVAENSIKKAKTVSFPQATPNSHTDKSKGNLKNFIFYGYNPARDSVVVGAVKLNRTDGKAPALLEHGGTVTRFSGGKAKVFRYRKRPFMRPALLKTIPRMPAEWRDAIR